MMMGVAVAACSSTPDVDCVAFAPTAAAQIEGRLDFFRTGCSTDSDCALIPEQVPCYTGCPSAVLASETTDATNDVMGQSDSICGGVSCTIDMGCAPSHAVCVAARCTTVAGDAGVPDAGAPDAGSADGGP
jgi:hypothetical protein